MTVCKYFREGRCTFGDRCRFEHPRGGSSNDRNQVCRFFLQGNCRYGDNCRNYHPSGQSQQSSGFSRGQRGSDRDPRSRQDFHGSGNRYSSNDRAVNYGQNQQRRYVQGDLRQYIPQGQGNRWRHQQDPTPFQRRDFTGRVPDQRRAGTTVTDMSEMIRHDMEEWELSGIWQLSSYSFSGNELSIGSLEEFSQEEIRWEAYQSKATGQVSNYETNLRRVLQANRDERNRLKTDRNGHSQLGGVGILPQGLGPSHLQHGGGILVGQTQSQQSILTGPQVQMPSFSNPIIGPGIFVSQQTQSQLQPGEGVIQSQAQAHQLEQKLVPQQQLQAQPSLVRTEQQAPTREQNVQGRKMSQEDLQQFKADRFVLGKVPECPPPPELC